MNWPIVLVRLIVMQLTLLSGVVWADFREGLDAYDRGDFSEAYEEWHPLARQGHADAQFQLGHLYDKGEGVPHDTTKASCWYRQAFRWYEKDAESGNGWSQYRLGVQFDKGLGVKEDKQTASHWYRLAAEQGNPSAQFQMGYMYAVGEGVPRDYLKAYTWASLADANGSKGAAVLKEQVAAHLSGEQMVEGRRLAEEWTPTKPLKDLSPFIEEENIFHSEEDDMSDCESSPLADSLPPSLQPSEKSRSGPSSSPPSPVQPQDLEAGSKGKGAVVLEIEAHDLSWVMVQSDHDPDSKKETLLQPGQRMGWTASKEFLVTLGNAGSVDVYLNGELLKKFGGKGQIIRNKVLTPERFPPRPQNSLGDKKRYLTEVQKAIDRQWVAPLVQEEKLVCILKFRVEKTGLISDIVVEQGSGNEQYDSAARRAIQAVNPLPPFSGNMSQSFVEVKYRFKME